MVKIDKFEIFGSLIPLDVDRSSKLEDYLMNKITSQSKKIDSISKELVKSSAIEELFKYNNIFSNDEITYKSSKLSDIVSKYFPEVKRGIAYYPETLYALNNIFKYQILMNTINKYPKKTKEIYKNIRPKLDMTQLLSYDFILNK